MAQILTLKEKQPEAGKEAIVKKCIFIETIESNRIWSFSIIYLHENEMKQIDYYKLNDFLELYEIIKHEETDDKEMSFARIRQILEVPNQYTYQQFQVTNEKGYHENIYQHPIFGLWTLEDGQLLRVSLASQTLDELLTKIKEKGLVITMK